MPTMNLKLGIVISCGGVDKVESKNIKYTCPRKDVLPEFRKIMS